MSTNTHQLPALRFLALVEVQMQVHKNLHGDVNGVTHRAKETRPGQRQREKGGRYKKRQWGGGV